MCLIKAKVTVTGRKGSNLAQRKQYACAYVHACLQPLWRAAEGFELGSDTAATTPLWGANPVLSCGISEMPWARHMCWDRVSQAVRITQPALHSQDTHSHSLYSLGNVVRFNRYYTHAVLTHKMSNVTMNVSRSNIFTAGSLVKIT